MWIRSKEAKERTTAAGGSDPRSDRMEPTAEKMLLDATTFSRTRGAGGTAPTAQNTPLTSGSILDTKSLTGLFAARLNHSSKSAGLESRGKKVCLNTRNVKKKGCLPNCRSCAGLYRSRLYCADTGVWANHRLYQIQHCHACQSASFPPRFQSGTPETAASQRDCVQDSARHLSPLKSVQRALNKGQTSPSPAASFCNHAPHYLQTFICLPAHLPKQPAIKLN